MKVVIAIDSFKGSMSSMEAGNAAREGVLRAREAQVVVRPLADGGEGTAEALVEGLGGTYVDVSVTGPMGEPITARYGILKKTENSAAECGITLVKRENLNPWRASTTGVGQMIRDAIERGCRNFIIGLGGRTPPHFKKCCAFGGGWSGRRTRLCFPQLSAQCGIEVRNFDRA